MNVTSAPLVLMYHGIVRQAREADGLDGPAIERQIGWLKQRVSFAHPKDDYRPSHGKPRVLLTFDDGFLNHLEVVAPILKKHSVPALFFIPTRHGEPGKYLWFTYLRMLFRRFPWKSFTFDGMEVDMTVHRSESVRALRDRLFALRPHPAAMYGALESELPPLEEFVSREELREECIGLSAAAVEELFQHPDFVPGVHTTDHPILTLCETEEISRQIVSNRRWLEQTSGRSCASIAYPGGDYDDRVLQASRDAGMTSGYAILPRSRSDGSFGIARTGIYSASLLKLGIKVRLSRWISLDRLPRLRRAEQPV